jgi:hypothetical protein
VNKFIPIVLRIAVSSLHVAVGYPADALDDTKGIAVVSASNPVPVSKTAIRAVATVPPRRTLDLRPPDLRSLHVQNLQQLVTSADSDEAEGVTIAAEPLLLEEDPDTHLSVAGIASVYWAARHPRQAWRVFLPVQLDGYDASADIRVTCAAFARAQSGPVACP